MPPKTSPSSGTGYFCEPKTDSHVPTTQATETDATKQPFILDAGRYPTVKVTKTVVGRVEK